MVGGMLEDAVAALVDATSPEPSDSRGQGVAGRPGSSKFKASESESASRSSSLKTLNSGVVGRSSSAICELASAPAVVLGSRAKRLTSSWVGGRRSEIARGRRVRGQVLWAWSHSVMAARSKWWP